MCFLDLSKAFDTVDRPLLWEILWRAGHLRKFVGLLRMEARVRVRSLDFDPFGLSRGVKQGCTLAPVLFNLSVGYITKLLAAQVGLDRGPHVYRLSLRNFQLKM